MVKEAEENVRGLKETHRSAGRQMRRERKGKIMTQDCVWFSSGMFVRGNKQLVLQE